MQKQLSTTTTTLTAEAIAYFIEDALRDGKTVRLNNNEVLVGLGSTSVFALEDGGLAYSRGDDFGVYAGSARVNAGSRVEIWY